LYSIEIDEGIERHVTRYNGKTNKINKAAAILITPPSLFGQARKIA